MRLKSLSEIWKRAEPRTRSNNGKGSHPSRGAKDGASAKLKASGFCAFANVGCGYVVELVSFHLLGGGAEVQAAIFVR